MMLKYATHQNFCVQFPKFYKPCGPDGIYFCNILFTIETPPRSDRAPPVVRYLPVSHVAPSYPVAVHAHVYEGTIPLLSSTHVPPFLHGDQKHNGAAGERDYC